MRETGLRAVPAPPRTVPRRHPVVVGHRGAPAHRPEHTWSGYSLALDLGAELIEPDVVVSRDGALVVRHENELSLSTDVAAHPGFADRRRTQDVAGEVYTGWFAEDFTLAELRTLRAVERWPQLRPGNTRFDRTEPVLTLAEVVALATSRGARVQAELKNPTWSAAQGLPMVELVVAELRALGATGPDSPVVLQSFDVEGVQALRAALGATSPPLVQLVDGGAVHDHLVTPAGLRGISTYADGIGPAKSRILTLDDTGALTGVTDLVAQAHRAGLTVTPWTVRAENRFLPVHLRRGTDPGARGDVGAETRLLLALGVDGVITDSPEVAVRERAELAAPALAPVRPRA
ncbi:glycerophosphodiester phosphodiesterase family protein [Modestobacter sp. Leaf380]|uniref:glycerophosphodiester phosphodiesterase family protein n=1 Tax=Modestobacter sp. Leaf380 TaxID=1736356 RepID=UPI000700AD04|nr:glycerophosphodiester phosphodiesterase family protein [Modestobacter sp. Leaf380]KQS63881.1 glycerophosphodiester phosphodiesterase [Modestobacter sp. Leaf380]